MNLYQLDQSNFGHAVYKKISSKYPLCPVIFLDQSNLDHAVYKKISSNYHLCQVYFCQRGLSSVCGYKCVKAYFIQLPPIVLFAFATQNYSCSNISAVKTPSNLTSNRPRTPYGSPATPRILDACTAGMTRTAWL